MAGTKPSSLANTMTGIWALQILASGNQLLTKIEDGINSGSGGVLKTVENWLLERVRDIYNGVVGFLAPQGPGAFGWLEAAPSWLDTLFTATYSTLSEHRSRLLWLQNGFIAAIHKQLNLDIGNAEDSAKEWASKLATSLTNAMIALWSQVNAHLAADVATLNRTIVSAHDDALRWTNKQVAILSADIVAIVKFVQQQAAAAVAAAKAYTDGQIKSVNTKLTLLGITTAAALAAAVSFIVGTAIPDAIEIAIGALNAEAAASMLLQWEIVATTTNRWLAELTLVDLNPVWATNVVSELPATSLAAADADLTGGLKAVTDYIGNAGVPLYRNLKSFGEDTAELDGVITTVLLGGLTAAAVADPEGTADVVDELLAAPLNDVLTAVTGLVGLT
jgi:hypothetical protein